MKGIINQDCHMYAIQTDDLTKSFIPIRSLIDVVSHPFKKVKPIVAVDKVNLQVNKGEISGLLGTNGAGKTTLIKMLCTLISPTSGRVLVGGYDVAKDEEKVRGCVGLVTCEERSFYWRLTGRQNLQFYGNLYNLKTSEIRNRIRQLSHLLELEDILEQRFDSYSTGTKQKMAIARALIHDPEIIFMDEPTRSLDPMMAAEVRSFIKKELVEQQGKTIVLATHQLQEAEQLCDRIAVMNRGHFVTVGSLEELQEECFIRNASLEQIFVHLAENSVD